MHTQWLFGFMVLELTLSLVPIDVIPSLDGLN